ncbi:MAG: restriction endonuclease subunit S [bacterium]|nr:restriction endonuclease subunit S [bacterium]
MNNAIKCLKDVARIQAGYHARSKVRRSHEGTHHLIQGEHFDSNHRLHWDRLIKFHPERNPNLYIVNQGDILFQARGVENFAYYVTQSPENILAASSFYIIKVEDKNLHPGFLAWWFSQPPCQSYFKTHVGVAVTSFVKKETLANLKIVLPPLPVQLKIQKIIELRQREQDLQERLMERKHILTNALCFQYIDDHGE